MIPSAFKTANDVKLVAPYVFGEKHFMLRLEGITDCVCSYVATKGVQGFGAKRRPVTFPNGSIKVQLSQTRFKIALSLDEAKAIVANDYNNTVLHR